MGHGCNLPIHALSELPPGFPEDADGQEHPQSLLPVLGSLQGEAGKILWLLDLGFGVMLPLKMPRAEVADMS